MKKLFSTLTIVLLCITFLAGFLRLYNLGVWPVGFHIDEASLGYNGYSMLQTGKDEHGKRFPLYIDMFGDNRPTGYHYLTILPVALFGLTEFATRLPGAVFGSLSVIAFFYLVFAISGDKKISLISSMLLAIAPWHIVSSRASAEAIVALFFIMTGFALIIRSLGNQRVGQLIGGFIALAISFQLYHTPRVFVPLVVASVLCVAYLRRQAFSSQFKRVGLMCCILLASLSFLLIFIVSGGTGRFKQVSIFGFPETKLVMEEQFREDGKWGVPSAFVKVFHNKIVNYSLTFISNYSDYFTGKFLFIEGGKPMWYKIPNMGLLYLVEFPFLIIGAAYLLTQKRRRLKFPLVWLVLAPVVAAITTDDIPNVQRVMVLFPMFELITAYGIVQVLSYWSSSMRVRMSVAIATLFLLNATYFLHQYTVHASIHLTLYRFNGFKEMVAAVAKEYESADTIVMTKTAGGIYPHVLFYTPYDPAVYQSEGSPKDPDFGGFGKFLFTPQFCPSIQGDDRLPKSGKVIYVDSGTCEISPLVKQQKILREDGTVAFIITTNRED